MNKYLNIFLHGTFITFNKPLKRPDNDQMSENRLQQSVLRITNPVFYWYPFFWRNRKQKT